MTRKLVQTGSSLAVTLPKAIVDELKLKKGDEVEVSIHPRTGAVIVRAGVRHVDGGRVTKRFATRADDLLKRRSILYRELAK
jgi:antitoxin component of MazEF toxin-antitoxin module